MTTRYTGARQFHCSAVTTDKDVQQVLDYDIDVYNPLANSERESFDNRRPCFWAYQRVATTSRSRFSLIVAKSHIGLYKDRRFDMRNMLYETA